MTSTLPASADSAAPDSPAPAAPGGPDQIQGLPDVAVPVDQAGIDALRVEIDAIDAELVRLIQQRTACSHAIGAARKQLGGTRIVYSREMQVLQRFRVLGSAGTDLGMMLLAMGRGRLGRR